jgi:hypothetical protein
MKTRFIQFRAIILGMIMLAFWNGQAQDTKNNIDKAIGAANKEYLAMVKVNLE